MASTAIKTRWAQPRCPSLFRPAVSVKILLMLVKASCGAMATLWTGVTRRQDDIPWLFVEWAAGTRPADTIFSAVALTGNAGRLWSRRRRLAAWLQVERQRSELRKEAEGGYKGPLGDGRRRGQPLH